MNNLPEEKEVEPFHDFICIHCEGGVAYTTETMKQHLKDVHEIDFDKVQMAEQMIIHSDAKWFYQSCYMVYVDHTPMFIRKFRMMRSTPFPGQMVKQ